MQKSSETCSYMALIGDDRRVWGQYHHGYCSFYFINNQNVTDIHLTLEGVEALRLVIENLQKDLNKNNKFHTISTQAHSPNKKTNLVSAKKAGCGKKTKKRPSTTKRKK